MSNIELLILLIYLFNTYSLVLMFILKAKDINILEKIHLLIFAPISFVVII
jgi:hypothetical protein